MIRLTKDQKRSVSLAINCSQGLLVVQRPSDDDDLPNEWGLPAASLREAETWQEAARRIGREKLGVDLEIGQELNRGELQRKKYNLEMRLFEAAIVDGAPAVPQPDLSVTQYQDWKWGSAADLKPAAEKGSLCCKLYLDS